MLPRLLPGLFVIFCFFNIRAQVNAEQVIAIGRNVMSLDDYVLAIQYFNHAIKAKPYLSDPYYLRGLAKLNLDDFLGAEQDCSMAIERNKFKKDAFRVRGYARLRLGKDSLSIQDFDVVLADNPYDTDILYYKAIAEMQTNNFSAADSVITALVKINPDFSEAWTVKANMELERNDTVAALASLNKALELSESDYMPYLRMVEIFDKQNRWEEALEAMNKVIRLAPDESDMYLNRGYIRYRNNDYMGAMDDYNYAIQIKPDNYNAMYNRALLRYEVRDLDNAIADFSAIIDHDKTNYHAIFNRALIYLEKKQYNQAVSDIEAIVKRFPKFYTAYNALAQCYLDMGQLDKAVQNYTEVLNLAPDNFFARYNREQIYMKQRKYSKALADIQYIINQYPKFYPIYYDLAQCRYEAGDQKGAFAAMNKADEMVRNYVDNPKKYPLDRPTIALASNSNPLDDVEIKRYGADPDTESEMMEKFNQLITTTHEVTSEVSFKDRIKGRVQDHEHIVGLEPMYVITVFPPPESFKAEASFFKELAELNRAALIAEHLYLTNEGTVSENSERVNNLFQLEEKYSHSIADGNRRPIDFLARAVVYTLLKNYDAALADIDEALTTSNDFVVALLLKSYLLSRQAVTERNSPNGEMQNLHDGGAHAAALAMQTLDRILQINSLLAPAWYNKGNLFYEFGDYASALDCYNKVIELDPECGEAYFNRGIVLMQRGEKDRAFKDFSMAGQLGVLQSYSIMKRIR